MYSASAQWNDAEVDNTQKAKVAIGIFSGADFGSNSVTSQFAYSLLNGNYIDSAMKRQVSSNLKNSNRVGFNFNYGLYAVFYNDTIKKKRVFNFFVAIKHKDYFNAGFTNDDFNLAFNGNASFAGKTAFISPLSINSLSYQQAEVGLVCTNFGGNAQFGIGLSFLAGQQYTAFNATGASLYTDTYGQYLTLNTNAQAWISDTSKGYLKRLNGMGASMDLYFRAPYKVRSKKGTISVSVSDIGFLWWNNHSITYQKDTTYNYSGISINSISDLQNANFHSLSKDSLQNKYLPFTKQAFYAPIPTTLAVNTNTALSEKFHLEIGYWNIFNANDVGYIYAQGDKYFSHGWMTALQLGYGDYTTINAALVLAKEFKTCRFNIAVNHLQGVIVPSKFGGAGAYAEFVYLFGK